MKIKDYPDGRYEKQTYQKNGSPIFLKGRCAICNGDIWTDEFYVPLDEEGLCHSGECIEKRAQNLQTAYKKASE